MALLDYACAVRHLAGTRGATVCAGVVGGWARAVDSVHLRALAAADRAALGRGLRALDERLPARLRGLHWDLTRQADLPLEAAAVEALGDRVDRLELLRAAEEWNDEAALLQAVDAIGTLLSPFGIAERGDRFGSYLERGRAWRSALAELRMVRIAVAFCSGGELPVLRDPMADAGASLGVHCADDHLTVSCSPSQRQVFAALPDGSRLVYSPQSSFQREWAR